MRPGTQIVESGAPALSVNGFAWGGSVDGHLGGFRPLVCHPAAKEWTVYKLPLALHSHLGACLHLRFPAHSFGALETAYARVERTQDGSPSRHCLQIAQRLVTLVRRLKSSRPARRAGSNADSREIRVSLCQKTRPPSCDPVFALNSGLRTHPVRGRPEDWSNAFARPF